MKTTIRFKGIPISTALREHALARIAIHLRRFGDRIRQVVLSLVDDNGPKGGVDKRCLVRVDGRRLGPVTISEVSDDWYVAVSRAVGRAGHTVARQQARAHREEGGAGHLRGRRADVGRAPGIARAESA